MAAFLYVYTCTGILVESVVQTKLHNLKNCNKSFQGGLLFYGMWRKTHQKFRKMGDLESN